jgi:subtilisin-like proprotein convertase family protein
MRKPQQTIAVTRRYFAQMTLLAALAVLFVGTNARADVPEMLHYQGYMTDAGGVPITAALHVEFRLFQTTENGQSFWDEVHDVEVVDGVFAVSLGSTNALDVQKLADGEAYLEIEVLWPLPKPEPVPASAPMSPRQKLVSTAFALHSGFSQACQQAENCDALGGIASDGFVTNETLEQTGYVTTADVDAILTSKNFCQAPCYSDTNVQTFLDDNGYVSGPLADYGNEDVLAYLTDNGYISGPHYTDGDSQTWLDTNGYVPGPHYADENVQAYLDDKGYVSGPLSDYSDEDVLTYLTDNGYVSGPHYADSDVETWLDDKGYISGPHYADSDVETWLGDKGYVPGPHYMDGDVQAWLDGNGYQPGGGQLPDHINFDLFTSILDRSYSSNDTPIVDPQDGNPVSSAIVVPVNGAAQAVKVSLNIDHEDITELKVILTGPTGTSVVLHNGEPGEAGNDLSVTFPDDRLPSEGSMSDFDGLEINGTWNLKVTDEKAGKTTTLNGWGVTVSFVSDDQLDFLADIDMQGHSMLNLAPPMADADAANKEYVDQTVSSQIAALGMPDHYCYMRNSDYACAPGFASKNRQVSFTIGFNQATNSSISPNSGANLPSMWINDWGGTNAQHGVSIGLTFCCR